jgi:outer membrane protein
MAPVIPAAAQQAQSIAVVDLDKVGQESSVGKKALAEINALQEKRRGELEQRQKNIQAMQEKLEKQKDILSAEMQEKLRNDIQKAITEGKRVQEDTATEIQAKIAATEKTIIDRLFPLLQKIGEQRGYSVIIFRSQVPYVSPKADITDDVIKIFNEELAGSAQTPTKQQ